MDMLRGNPLLFGALIAWTVITAVLIMLMLYRMTLESHEDDQVFIDPPQDRLANEQKALLAKINHINKPIHCLIMASSVLFVAMAGTWLYKRSTSIFLLASGAHPALSRTLARHTLRRALRLSPACRGRSRASFHSPGPFCSGAGVGAGQISEVWSERSATVRFAARISLCTAPAAVHSRDEAPRVARPRIIPSAFIDVLRRSSTTFALCFLCSSHMARYFSRSTSGRSWKPLTVETSSAKEVCSFAVFPTCL
jgi:hypothetical protein